MSEVKRYHVTEAGLVEGSALGRLNVVLGADHDRVTAERDAALEYAHQRSLDFDQLAKSFRDFLVTYENELSSVKGGFEPYGRGFESIAVELKRIYGVSNERADLLERDGARYRWLMSDAVLNGTLGIADGWIYFEFKDEAEKQIDAALKSESKSAGKLPNIGAIWERNGRTTTISPDPEHVGPADPWVFTLPTALKPAEPAKDEHVCTGCGSKGWTAKCKECVPY